MLVHVFDGAPLENRQINAHLHAVCVATHRQLNRSRVAFYDIFPVGRVVRHQQNKRLFFNALDGII